jgi:hypothetical protein
MPNLDYHGILVIFHINLFYVSFLLAIRYTAVYFTYVNFDASAEWGLSVLASGPGGAAAVVSGDRQALQVCKPPNTAH